MAGHVNISYRPVRAIGLLLILQVIGLAGLGAYEVLQVDWQRFSREAPSQQAIEVVVLALFVPPAVMTLLAALSFLVLRRRGWLLAAIAQGLNLGICLWLYTEFQPVYVYPVMAYCILMILYLNSQDVRVVFHPGRNKQKLRTPRAG
jgi:hypothetical protein